MCYGYKKYVYFSCALATTLKTEGMEMQAPCVRYDFKSLKSG